VPFLRNLHISLSSLSMFLLHVFPAICACMQCGAAAGILGLVASLAVFHAQNSHVEDLETANEISSSSSSSTQQQGGTSDSNTNMESSSSSSSQHEQQNQQRTNLLFNTFGVLVASLALAAYHDEGPLPGIAPLSFGPALIGGVTGRCVCVCVLIGGVTGVCVVCCLYGCGCGWACVYIFVCVCILLHKVHVGVMGWREGRSVS